MQVIVGDDPVQLRLPAGAPEQAGEAVLAAFQDGLITGAGQATGVRQRGRFCLLVGGMSAERRGGAEGLSMDHLLQQLPAAIHRVE